jgi:hypothetical protein
VVVNTYRRSVVDLAALRFYPAEAEHSAAPIPKDASLPGDRARAQAPCVASRRGGRIPMAHDGTMSARL